MAKLQALLETIPCPVCGGRQHDVVRKAAYPPDITPAALQGFYSASSHQRLIDQVVACRDCGMQFVNPRPDPEVLLTSYANAEDPVFVAQNDCRIRTFRRILERASGELGGKLRGRVLDVGCAGGAFLVAARETGLEPVGVEPSRWLADFGRSTYGLEIHQGILEPGLFRDQSFDVITMWDVLEHVPDPHSVLMLVRDLLKPGGVLLLSYPDVGSLPAKLMGSRWPFWLSVHLHMFDRGTIRRQLERASFRVGPMHRLWQTLELSYVLQRAGHYFSLFSSAAALTDRIGMGKVDCTYYMGQTWLAANRDDS